MPVYKRTNDNQGRVQPTGGDYYKASGVVKDILHIVTAAEETSRVIATGFRYDQGLNSLEVFLNGQLLRCKETILGTVYGDYTETTNFTVTFEAGVVHTGDQVRFRVTANSYDRSDPNNANINQLAKDYYGRNTTTGLLKNNGAMFSSGLVHAISYGTSIVAGYDYRNVDTLQNAITDIGSDNKTIYVTGGDWIIDSDITFPANVGLRIENGSKFVIDSAAVVTINGPFESGLYQVFDCVGTGKVVGLKYVTPQFFGAKADGVTDDAASITAAIVAASGGELHFCGNYATTGSPLTEVLTASSKWIADNEVSIKFIGSINNTSILFVQLSGYNLIIEGQFNLDGDNKVARGLMLYNSLVTMADASTLLINNVSVKNIYSSTHAYTAAGIAAVGAYTVVCCDNVVITNISRAAGAGVPGLQGSAGIITTGTAAIYPQKTVITNSYIDTIISEEDPSAAAYCDMDGIIAQSGLVEGASLIINNTNFRNCTGRSIKSQVSNNIIDSIIIISDEDSLLHMLNCVPINFQLGGGSISNLRVVYDALTGGASPFNTSNECLIGIGIISGKVSISNVEIVNNVDESVGVLKYLINTTLSTVSGIDIDISNVIYGGLGKTEIFFYGKLSRVNSLTVNNTTTNCTNVFLYSIDACSNAIINASGNYNLGAAIPLYSGVGAYPTIFGSKNYNFREGKIISFQPAPIARTTSMTFQAYMLQGFYGGIITITHTAGVTQEYTLPTGTNMDTYFPGGIDKACDWYLINLSVAGTDTATLKENTGHTIIGNPVVLNQSSGHFLTRKTATNTFVTYRVS